MTRPVSIKVEPLLSGYIIREGSTILDTSSSVTLIRSGSVNMIIDTGSPRVRDGLVKALKASNLARRDVGLVVNTHLHLDHCGCNDLFENARFIAHVLESPPAHFHKISGEVTLSPGIAILPTPGHCPGAITVFVTTDRKYAICGDALPTKENYQQHVPPFINTSPRLAIRSMDFIISWADVVVPGHGTPFEIIRKK